MDRLKIKNDDLFKILNKQIYVVIDLVIYKFKIYAYKIEMNSTKINDYSVKLCLTPLDSSLTSYYDEEYLVDYELYKVDWFDNISDAKRRVLHLKYNPKKQMSLFEV